jgi:hypothetical protein
MPLVFITTGRRYHPPQWLWPWRKGQRTTIALGKALPGLFVSRAEELHLEPDTPPEGVQVTHHKFHRRGVNAPQKGMWIFVLFSEPELDENRRKLVRDRVQRLVNGWFTSEGLEMPPEIAFDFKWGPTHGFLAVGGEAIRW